MIDAFGGYKRSGFKRILLYGGKNGIYGCCGHDIFGGSIWLKMFAAILCGSSSSVFGSGRSLSSIVGIGASPFFRSQVVVVECIHRQLLLLASVCILVSEKFLIEAMFWGKFYGFIWCVLVQLVSF